MPPGGSRSGAVYLWRASPGWRPLPPLVYLQGLGPHSTGRTRCQRLLQRIEVLGLARTFEVWLVARRGPLPRGVTLADVAEEHARAIRSRFDRPVDVVGESTGGSIALRLAADDPDVVARLVLVSAAARLGRRGRRAQEEAADSVDAGHPRRAAATILGTTTDRPVLGRILRIAGYALGRLVIGRGDHDLVVTIEAEDGSDALRDLDRVRAPTLVIGGGRDGYYSPSLFEQTAARIPHASYTQMRRKGHLTASLDHAVRKEIRRYLRSTPTGS